RNFCNSNLKSNKFTSSSSFLFVTPNPKPTRSTLDALVLTITGAGKASLLSVLPPSPLSESLVLILSTLHYRNHPPQQASSLPLVLLLLRFYWKLVLRS
ncbi:hypothetical protein G4B88_011303, partial [Cannabis sativa]